MAMLNIDRKNTDPYYRYKMPRLFAKVEGKGNGIKTVVVNMVEIAKSLSRPPSYPCKYFGCELGAQTQMDAKNERYIVNGAHEGDRLQELLDGFIKKFVLCPECDNPETVLHVDKKGNITQQCSACGNLGQIDPRQKLTTFISKNPPDGSQPAGKKGGKEKRKKEEKKNGSPKSSNGTPAERGGDDDVEWSVDTSEAAVKKRMGELSAGVKTLTVDEGASLNASDRVDAFFKFVQQKKANGLLAKDIGQIVQEAKRLEVFDKAPLVIAELVFDKNVQKQIKEYRAVFLRFVQGNKKAQKYLLGAFEQLVGKVHPELKARSPFILKTFYDGDILDEEILLEWDQKVSKRFVDKKIAEEIREKAAPFIKWLREAEEGSSSEEEGGVEVVYTSKPQIDPVDEKNDVDDADDIDVDAI